MYAVMCKLYVVCGNIDTVEYRPPTLAHSLEGIAIFQARTEMNIEFDL